MRLERSGQGMRARKNLTGASCVPYYRVPVSYRCFRPLLYQPCSRETCTQDWGVELESLSPLTVVKPGRSVCHVEEWLLFSGVEKPDNTDEAIAEALSPLAARAGIVLPVARFDSWKNAEPED